MFVVLARGTLPLRAEAQTEASYTRQCALNQKQDSATAWALIRGEGVAQLSVYQDMAFLDLGLHAPL